MRRFVFTIATAATALLAVACQDSTEPVALEGSGGSGNDTKCRAAAVDENGFPLVPLTGTFDNVVVPRGAACFLLNSTVRGNVKALQDSRLFMEGDIVRGNVQGDKASAVIVALSTVHGNIHIIEAHDQIFLSAAVFESVLPNGNIQIEKGRFPTGDWNVGFNDVRKGNIQVVENGSTFFSGVFVNTVAEDVQVFKNTSFLGNDVVDNIIGENLQCKENQQPFIGQPNVVGGNAEGQCAGSGGMSASVPARPRTASGGFSFLKRTK